MNAEDLRERATDALTSTGAKKLYAGMLAMIVTVTVLYFTAQSRGIVATILYAFLFVMSAILFPMAIGLFGSAVPNFIGKLHLILGAVAFDHHYLVQRENHWDWCPGDRGRVWIDGEWHEISEESQSNYSVLGWRPFGILRYKEDSTWTEYRADTKATKNRGTAETDGGRSGVERGGIKEATPPAVTGIDGTWVLDLKRVYSRGIKKIGDVELIETAEEVIERGEVGGGRLSGTSPLVENMAMLILGVLVGFGYVMLS